MQHQRVLSDGQAALGATLRFGQRHLGAAKWEPGPGSEAAAELSNTETRQGGGPWGEDPPRTAYAAANLMMTGVLDNLASIHQLLEPDAGDRADRGRPLGDRDRLGGLVADGAGHRRAPQGMP